MAQCRTKLTWMSGFAMGISRLSWMCVVACVLSLFSPSTHGQDFNPVYFTSEPSNVVAVPGTTVTLNCSVQSSLVPIITWTQDSSPVSVDNPTRTQLPNGALRIASVSLRDEGSYQCSAELDNGDFFASLNSKRGTITVAKLMLQDGPSSTTAFDGDTVYFQCNFNSVPAPEISWMKNGQVLDLTEERISARYTLMPSGGLEIREVRSTDSGTYRCQGVNRLITTPVQSPTADLTIIPGTNPTFEFIQTPRETEAPVGQTVVLEAATNAQAVFTWFKDGEEIVIVGTGTDDHYALLGQGSLRIKQLGEIDTGLYRVMATPIADGTALDHIVKVTALVLLKFNIRPQNTYVNVGSSVTLNCNAYGIPGPTTSWFKEGEELEPGDIYQVSAGSLTIENVIQEDAGIYQCVADNRLENIQASAELIVLKEGVPIPTLPPTTTLTTTPLPPLPITTKIPPGQPDSGPVPTKPLFLTATDIQAQSFRLMWREPVQPNGALQNYRVYLKWNGGQKIEFINDLSQLAKVISDLIPETRYEVTIYAVNENGAGPASDVLVVETLPHGEYLGPPISVRARPETDTCTALLITWQAPQGNVLNYKVYYADLSAGVAQEHELYTEQNFYLITNLKPLTSYGLRVVGFNENGPGTSSNNLEASTSQCKPSGIPDNITVESDSSTSIIVTWDPPLFDQRNGLISGYKLKYRTIENGKRTHSLVIDGMQRSYTIPDLERGTGYEVRMAAYNINGTGPYSDWILAMTFDIDKNGTVTTSTPIGLQALVTSPYVAVLTWKDEDYSPEEKPRDRYYTVKYTTNYPTSNKYFYANSSDSSVVIRNLSPFTTYYFEVMAVTGNRHSEYSLVVENKTFEAAPSSAPRSLTIVDVENSTTAVSLNWQPPKDPNGLISGYTIYYSTTDSPDEIDWIIEVLNGDELTKTIHGMTSDTTYYFKIRAHTSKGEGPVSDVVSHTMAEPTPPAPLADAAAMGFPWWLWLVIILAVLFIIIIAVLLLLCFICGCCACCADCCPSCAALCEDACGCCAPFCGPLAACFAACFPCCCEDEDDCAKCWLKFCCGATACVCCGQAYRERRKAKGSANLVGYHAVSQNGKVIGSTGPVPPDLWINHEGVEMKKVDGKKGGTIGTKAEERERLDHGGGVDQQREQVQETTFTQSSVQNQQETQHLESAEDRLDSSNRQSQYETPTLMSATSHRSSLESAPSITISQPRTRTHSMNRSEVQNQSAGTTSPRYATWGAKANVNDPQQSSVNYNTTNIHVEDVRNNYSANDSYSTLRDGGYQGELGTNGQAYSTLDRQSSHNNAHSGQNQIITFPDQNAGPQPFTITFEETTTSHSVEKSVPLPDGTNFKTSSSHQTFAKSYSTSDASQDQNLQAMLQGGLENGPLAIEIPSTTNTSLPAITAAPLYRSASFNPIPQDSRSTGTQSSSFSNTMGRSPPPPNYNFATSENASAQTQSSGYASGSVNARGRTSSVGASSLDSGGYRTRGSESYLIVPDQRSHLHTASPIDIPAPSTSPFSPSFQNYESYRAEETDNSYGRSASDLFGGSAGINVTRPRAGYHTIDRSTGLNIDSAYGSPTGYNSGFGSYSGASTLGKQPSGGFSVPSSRPGNSYQSSAFQDTSDSFRSYNSNSNIGNGGTSHFSYNNNNASSVTPSRLTEIEHAEVQTPNSRFNSRSDLLQAASSLDRDFDLTTPTRPLRRSMSVDNELGIENDSYWSSSSNTNLLSGYQTQRESRETQETSGSETQRGRSRLVGDRSYGGVGSRSRSLDRFGDREVKIQAPAYSPLKRNQQAGVARVRHQPLPVVTPRAPDVTYRGVGDGTSPGTANRSFSTEDLNTEMLNLEGLMKDLNAITASELQS